MVMGDGPVADPDQADLDTVPTPALGSRQSIGDGRRMILGSSTSKRLLRPLRDTRHRRRVERLVGRFAETFRVIDYEILWTAPTCNAQAFLLDGRRCVRLYGGLARHRRLSIAAVAWVMAHETGHHLGGRPADPHYFWLSSETRADEWAATRGLRRVFGEPLARRYATLGRREATRIARP
jgi:hypothetical protein